MENRFWLLYKHKIRRKNENRSTKRIKFYFVLEFVLIGSLIFQLLQHSAKLLELSAKLFDGKIHKASLSTLLLFDYNSAQPSLTG